MKFKTADEAIKLIEIECDSLKNMLLEKNRKYGNSALDPIRTFSKADTVEQIKVRLDDKLSRLRNVQVDDVEDIVLDLLGYLILLRVAVKLKCKNSNNIFKRISRIFNKIFFTNLFCFESY